MHTVQKFVDNWKVKKKNRFKELFAYTYNDIVFRFSNARR